MAQAVLTENSSGQFLIFFFQFLEFIWTKAEEISSKGKPINDWPVQKVRDRD